MSDGLPVIETERLVLRPYSLSDAPVVHAMCDDPAIAGTTLAIPHPYPDGAAEQWISTHAENLRQGTEVVLAITLRRQKTTAESSAPYRSVNVLPRLKTARYPVTGKETCYAAVVTVRLRPSLNARRAM